MKLEPITNMDILNATLDKTRELFGNLELHMYSAAGILPHYYERCKGLSDIVEIGTWRGVSALVFASWGLKVHTFDIIEQEQCKPLWAMFGIEVDQHVCNDRDDIRGWMDIVPFDVAFIDAVHNYENVKADFAMVERCGRVIFHDYDELDFPGIFQFCNEVGATPGPYSAWWENNDRP